MRILVINSGSSSVKYQLIEMGGPTVLAGGLVDRIGEERSTLTHRLRTDSDEEEQSEERVIPDHDAAFRAIVDTLERRDLLRDLGGVGHRVVHGGERYGGPTVIDDVVVAAIRELAPLAPLHNPANARGIEVARRLRPDVPHVAVFDTSFHQTLPPRAFRYAVPGAWYRDHGVRRYGFHGTSHDYVSRTACEHLAIDPAATNLITAHLGNGASMAAIAGGRSVDTSMGLSPLEGLVMGTRSGDVDPAVVFHLGRVAGMDRDETESALNRASGLKGLCGDNDLRIVSERAADGDADAELALELFCYRVRKYIGAYTAALGRVDALVFTAGIGERSAVVRERCCSGMEALGIAIDLRRNAEAGGGVIRISQDASPVTVLVVPTDEEREIAEQAVTAISR
jgi:acetate kinase